MNENIKLREIERLLKDLRVRFAQYLKDYPNNNLRRSDAPSYSPFLVPLELRTSEVNFLYKNFGSVEYAVEAILNWFLQHNFTSSGQSLEINQKSLMFFLYHDSNYKEIIGNYSHINKFIDEVKMHHSESNYLDSLQYINDLLNIKK